MAIVLSLAVSLAAPSSATAHPHAWIDLRTSVVLDADGRAVAIEQRWSFDPLYSALLIDDLGTTAQALRVHGTDMLGRLRAYDYYTEVRIDGKIQAPGTVHEFTSGVQSDRYWIRFVMPLGAPVDPTTHRLSYSVFDPTYYIEILHPKGGKVELVGTKPGRCVARIDPPKPAADDILRARSLAVDSRPDNSLGALFAERVEVGCE